MLSRRYSLALLAAGLCAIGVVPPRVSQAPLSASRVGLYDPDPNHLWNRIHDCLRVRVAPDGSEYGSDSLDPLLWAETKYLLTEPSHGRAVKLLDEFLASNAERLVAEPLKRAVFQHDLWAVFDWLASPSEGDKTARSALMGRIARVMRRVALSTKQIEALPDNYASSSNSLLPRDLFSATGPWVSVGGIHEIVPQHARELSRSAFVVFWNLPGGRAATKAYLKKLWEFPQPFVRDDRSPNDGESRVMLNPALPPVPGGTRIALVRKLLLIDDHGVIVPSTIVESVQLRVFPGRQGFSEFLMSRPDLFAAKPTGLQEAGGDNLLFLTFSSHGFDAFEGKNWRRPALPRIADRCAACHQVDFQPGLPSVRSVNALLKPNALVDTSHERWSQWFTQPLLAAANKSRSYEWGVLQGIWQSQPE